MFNPSSFFQTPLKQPKQMQTPIGNKVWEEPCGTSQAVENDMSKMPTVTANQKII